MDSSTEKGKTGEQFVEELASRTFLSFWCYPNPHDETGDKKEICDLLILFKGCCIICQVKNYEFKGNYERYFRKAVDAAVKQISGAARKLFGQNREIFIRHKELGLQKFEPQKYSKVIRLVIHLGAGLAYQHLGKLTALDGDFVHTFGREDFEYLLRELITISDLVEYLKLRERLLSEIEKVAILGAEKDLLAVYLMNDDYLRELINENKDGRVLLDCENGWKKFEAERIDNDSVVLETENLLLDWVRRDLFHLDKTRALAEDLMSLNRNSRRLYAVSFLDFNATCQEKKYNRIVRRHITLSGIGFIFFYYPMVLSDEELKAATLVAASGFSWHSKYEVRRIIVIGIPAKGNFTFSTYDFSNIEFNEEGLKKTLAEYGWFQDENLIHYEIDMRRKRDIGNQQ